MTEEIKEKLVAWEAEYNDPKYFAEDPIAFPREFLRRGAAKKDVEIASVFAAHFAWGRRSMIVRDLERFFDFIEWRPWDYVRSGSYRSDAVSIHRTVKWNDTAAICANLKALYGSGVEMETLTQAQIRTLVYGQKAEPRACNKKINMMRRWLVRHDGKVDLGLWTSVPTDSLVIPLDVHVYDEAAALGLTCRRQKDLATALQITDEFKQIWPEDPARGDFALFGYGVTRNA